MGSEVEQNGKPFRPTWNYLGKHPRGFALDTLEMLESVRNVLEDIRNELRLLNSKQMLQCDVRRDIRAIATEARVAARTRKAK